MWLSTPKWYENLYLGGETCHCVVKIPQKMLYHGSQMFYKGWCYEYHLHQKVWLIATF